MSAFRTAMAVIFFGICAPALAQTPGIGETRPVAPEPQEKKSAAADAAKPQTDAQRALKRCDELSGTLREDCLRENRAAAGEAGAGATRRPEPPTAPPPQNPR
jgi:hypothetical protein